MELVDKNIKKIQILCELHNVEQLYLFGSANTDDFNPKSDIDFLVKFKPFDLSLYFINYTVLKTKLHKLLKRKIDLVEEQTLTNPYLIKSINNNKKIIYG
jgi:uncharacterized protein